ncbi:SCP-like extracellular protein [Metabacillus halosaccharovorans]|nr:CAP domain-containing protein [Metabacillus halosaccharovorans]MBU7593420.1 SCP-like extracellular protein [Metabacillus halosaccharovorans]
MPDRMLTNDPNGMTISSSKTDLSSKDYPHTRAIAVQDARYKFIKANSKEEAEKQARQFIDQQKQQALQNGNQIAKQYQSQQQQSANRQQAPTDRQQAQNNQQQQNQAPAEQQGKATDQQQKQEPTQPQQQQPAAEAPKKDESQAQGVSQVAQQVIDLTNAERKKSGLPALKADTQLSGVAQKKSEDMRQNNYFSHTSPTYGSPFDMMRDFGVTYKTAGENIAQGQRSAQEVVQAWMNSEGHRKNILSKDFTHIGIGYDSNGHHWTQMFIGK